MNAPIKKSVVKGRVLTVLLILGFLISGACMFFLAKTGVSLRLAPVISPSPMKGDLSEMVDSLFVRLLPELRPHAYVLWGALPLNSETETLVLRLKDRYEAIYKNKVQYIPNGSELDNSFFEFCESPCWILLPQLMANQLSENVFLGQRPIIQKSSHQSVTIVYFDKISSKPEVDQKCIEEKLLDFECLKQISLRDAWKKVKTQEHRYFFVRQYNQKDLFLFIQNP